MKTIRRGDQGPDVASWQRTLNSGQKPTTWTNTRGLSGVWGASPWPLTEDGIFGAGTERATEAWQAARGLAADGIVGPASWQAAGVVSVVSSLPPLLYGTDVSAIQGILDAKVWRALRDLAVRFAMMRSIVGNETWIDPAFDENMARAADLGIAVGKYLFAYPLRHIDPRVQVEDWLRRLEKFVRPDEITLAIDLEWPPREEYKTVAATKTLVFPWRDQWKIDGSFIRDWGVAALERGRELTGRPLLCYSFRYFLDCIEAWKAPELAASPLWLADYAARGRFPSAEEVARYKIPGPWTEIAIVQHDGDGGLTLPNGRDADFNVMTGGEERLRALMGRVAPAQALPVVDLERARLDVMGALVDDAVAQYRRERITEAIAA